MTMFVFPKEVHCLYVGLGNTAKTEYKGWGSQTQINFVS